MYLSFFYRCAKAGTLKIGFENVDKTGFADFNSMEVSEEIAATGGYVQYTCSGLWNGTGDFKLEFDGDIYLYMLVLSTDKIEALTYKYKTLFEQSERLVKISAAVYDKDERALQETGLMVQPEGTGIYIKDANGKLALIGVGVEETDAEGKKKTVIKLTADNINLEGLVTANGNFKVKEDGSIEANNAKIKGYVYSVFKQIEKSDAELLEAGDYLKPAVYKLKTNLYVDASSCEVVLPVTKEYEGARVLIMDSHFIKTRTMYPPTSIRTEDGSPVVSGLFAQSATDRRFRADLLTIDAGCVELILQNIVCEEESGEPIIPSLHWVLVSNSCQNLYLKYKDEEYEYRYNLDKLS